MNTRAIFDFQNPRVLAAHLLFWSLLVMPKYPYLHEVGLRQHATIGMGLGWLLIYGVGLLNALFLVPRFFKTGRFGWYAPAVLVLGMTGAYFMGRIQAFVLPVEELQDIIAPFPWDVPPPDRPWKLLLMTTSFLPVLAILFISLIHRVVGHYTSKEKEAHAFREAQLQSELKLLRTQINPHFLFNTLNNLYALVQTRPALVEDLLLRFGEILRFVTYESHQEHIPLSQELGYIENYIHLQRVKDEEFTAIKLETEGPLDQVQLEPMLLIPFVENAFKHSYRENSLDRWINIRIRVESDGLHALIENNLPEAPNADTQPGGVGLENVRQRLLLCYPDAHKLDIRTLSDRFQVNLWLNPTASASSL